MTAFAADVPARIFMSYRRDESAYPAAWLFKRLADRFGRDQVFKDVDSVELGDDFVEVIATAVGSCDVLLALIGRQWLTITGQDGLPRLDNAADFVRLEIEAALARNVRVIPILVDGAQMPRADELPASLAKLARRQALELSPVRFEVESDRLLKALDRMISEARVQARQEAERIDDPKFGFERARLRKEQVFLSSAPEDRWAAQVIANELRKRFQRVFDYQDGGEALPAGTARMTELYSWLHDSRIGIPLLSSSYIKKRTCMREAAHMMMRADQNTMRVFPLNVDGVEMPAFLQTLQFRPVDRSTDVVRLVDDIVAQYDSARRDATLVARNRRSH